MRRPTPVAWWLRPTGPNLGAAVASGGLALLLAVRALTLIAAVLLVAIAPTGAGVGTTLAVAAAVATLIIGTSAALRRAGRPGSRLLTGALVVDVLALDVAIALTGAQDSPLRLLACALPIAAAFSLPSASAVLLGTLAAVGLAAASDDLGDAAAAVASLVPAVVIAAAVARRRDALFDRVRELTALRKDVLGRPGLEGQRVAGELRDVALAPVRELLVALNRAPLDVGSAARRAADVAQAVRSVVAELHALSAQPTNLPVALRDLAHRRAPDADFDLEGSPQTLDPELQQLVLAVARDGLAQLVRPGTRTVSLRIDEDGHGCVTVDIGVDPPSVPSGGDSAMVLAERAERTGGWVRAEEGRLRVALPGAAPRPIPSPRRVRARDDALGLLVLGRAVGLAAALAAGLLAGGSDPWLVPVALAAIALAPFHARIVRAGPGAFVAFVLVDLVAFGLISHFLDDARAVVLPLAIAIPVLYAFVLSPADTIGAGLASGLAVIAGGGRDDAFLIGFAWATLVAGLLSLGIRDLRTALDALEDRHRTLLDRLLDEEERRRRDLAQELHDDALQLLLAARQELEEAATDPSAVSYAQTALGEAAISLAQVIGEAEVDQGAESLLSGLGPALTGALSPVRRRRGAPRIDLEVDERAAGSHDGLLVRLARELATNAVKHAGAGAVRVRVGREGDAVVLEVDDDGAGFDLDVVASAVTRGHVGLAFAGERVRAAGGTIELGTAAAGGASVRVRLPAASPAAGPAASSAAGARA